jgi:threonylcarbamoyladenosine tRNA methylthiotransferase MtaB
MFANTLALVADCGIVHGHIFPYSPRTGTPAARMPQVEPEVVKARAARLRAAGDAALARHLDRQAGRTLTGLVERPGAARAADFTEIAFEGEAPVGGLADLLVTGHDGKRLLATRENPLIPA